MQCMRRCIVCLCLKPMKNSCFECPDRHELCWNTCEKYVAAKARHEEIKAKERKIKATEQALREILRREI